MIDASSNEGILFEVQTPLGFWVRTTISYWELITTVKHPIMRSHRAAVQEALTHPHEVHLSKSDAQVYLFYGAHGTRRWVCAVAKRLNGEGFLITAYRTSGIKEGTLVWPK
jgi:hypothetical protein